jgi:hypothetical protein
MISFIEDKNQLHKLDNKQLIIIPVIDDKTHFLYKDVTLLFILDIESKDEYIINIKHPDYLLYKDELPLIHSSVVFTTDKKTLLYKNIVTIDSIDLNFLIYPEEHKQFEFDRYIPKSYLLFQNRFVNWAIYPLSILIQMCRHSAYDMLKYFEKYSEFISEIQIIDNLYYQTLFNTEANKFEFDYDLIYSNYNPYTLTNRPTNSSFGINLSALSKKDNTRSKLKSTNNENMLVQFDYSSFHVYLLTKMLNFHLPSDTDIYLYLNEQYKFSSKIDRSEIKMDFFKYIYGTKCYDSELSNIINKFKDSLFNIFQNFGYVKSFFLKRKVFFNSKTINQSNILFNYFLQNAETEYNLLKIQKILSNVPQQNCKLVLYTYDSFLFEIDKNQLQLIEQIKSILQEDGIPVTIQVGTNYGNLVDIY